MSNILESVNKRTQLVGQNRLELLLFKLNGRQRFGINVFKVKEVLQCPPLTSLPRLNSNVRGIAHVRGMTISVIDLSAAQVVAQLRTLRTVSLLSLSTTGVCKASWSVLLSVLSI